MYHTTNTLQAFLPMLDAKPRQGKLMAKTWMNHCFTAEEAGSKPSLNRIPKQTEYF